MARTKQTKRLAKAPAPKLREACSQRRPVEKTRVAAKQTTSRRPRDSPTSPAKSERPAQERVRAESQKASENQPNTERTIVSGGAEASVEGKAHADTSSSSAVQTGSRKGVVQTMSSEKKSVSNLQSMEIRHGKRARDSPDDDFTPKKHAVSNISRSSVLSVSTAVVTTAGLSISNSPVNLPATLPPEPLVSGDEVKWEIESIVDWRTQKSHGRLSQEVLVKWSGFGPEANTWEPIKAIPACFLESHKSLKAVQDKTAPESVEFSGKGEGGAGAASTGRVTSGARTGSCSEGSRRRASGSAHLWRESSLLWPTDQGVETEVLERAKARGERGGSHREAEDEVEQQLFRDELRALLLETWLGKSACE